MIKRPRPMQYPSAHMVPRYTAYPDAMGSPEIARAAAHPNPNAWGNTLVFRPPWVENEERAMIAIDNMTAGHRVPQVQNLVLSLDGVSTLQQDATFRWKIRFGAGGGNIAIVVDANGVQQLSLSAENIRVSLLCTNWGPNWPTAFVSPTQDVQGTVFFADGTTSTEAPTYTERFFIPAALPVITLTPPPGATSWRILGRPSTEADSPFQVDMDYEILPNSNGTPLDQYTGLYLEGIRVASVPFPASAAAIQVASPSVDVAGAIEWGLDL